MATTIADLIVKLSAQGIQGVERDLNKLGRSTKRTAADIETAGTSFALLGTAGAAAFALVAREAITFESAFAGVRKTVDASESEFATLSDQIRDLALEIPASARELANIAETAGQLGIEAGSIDEFTKTIAQLGTASNITGQEGAAMLAQFGNITGVSDPKDYERLGSAIVDLGNNSATTEQDILQLGLRLAGAGTTAGISGPEILGIAAALKSVGVEAEAGGTAFSKLIIRIAQAVETGNEDLEKFANVAGLSGEQFATAFRDNGADALGLFIEGLSKTKDQAGGLFGALEDLGLTEIRLRDALLRATGASDKFSESTKRGARAAEENNALQKEAAERYKTVESQLQLAVNQFRDITISIGEGALPAINSLLQSLRPLVDSVVQFARNNSELVGTLALVVGGLSGLAAGGGLTLVAISQVTSAVGALLPLLPKLAGGLGASKAAGGALASALPAAVTAVKGLGIAAAAAGAAFAGWELGKWIERNLPKVGEFERKIQELILSLGGLGDAITGQNAANKSLEHTTEQLAEALAEQGIIVKKDLFESMEQYSRRLRQAADDAGLVSKSTKEVGKEAGAAAPSVDAIERAVGRYERSLEGAKASVERFVPTYEGLSRTVSAGAVEWDRVAEAERAAAAQLAVIADNAPGAEAGLGGIADTAPRIAQVVAELSGAAQEIDFLRARADIAVGSVGDIGSTASDVAAVFPDIVDSIEEVDPALKRSGAAAEVWQRQVSTIVTDLGKDIAGAVASFDLSRLVDVFTKDLPTALTRFVSEFLVGKLFKALGDLVTDIFPGIKSAFGAIFGVGGGAANAAGGAASTAGSVATQIGQTIASGFGSILNTVTGAISAVTDIIGLFQNAKMETTLNAIEESTRRGTLYLGDRGDGGILGRLFSIEENAGYTTVNTDEIKASMWSVEANAETSARRLEDIELHAQRLTAIDTNIAAMATRQRLDVKLSTDMTGDEIVDAIMRRISLEASFVTA